MRHQLISVNITTEGSFKDVFEQLYPTLLLFTQRFTLREEEADDLVQEAFLKLWELRFDFSYLHQIKSFLYSCIKNSALNDIQHQRVALRYKQEIGRTEPYELDINEQIILSETYHILIKAVETLPPKMKYIILSYLKGKAPNEIATTMQISIETVYSQKQLALKRLQKAFGKYSSLFLFLILI